MFVMSGPSEIMTSDETLLCRAFDTVLGEGVEIVDGKRQFTGNQPYVEFTFIGNVQPVTGDDLLLVPEGDRFDEQLFVWAPADIQRVPELNCLVFRDYWYQVQAAESWGPSYTKLRIQRVDVGPDRAIGV